MVIEIDGLRFGYAAAPLLRIDTLRVAEGEHLMIEGPSGSGKTTLLFLLAGLLNPQAGRIVIAGTDLAALQGRALDAFRGQHIGLVFQQAHLMAPLTVLQNLLAVPLMSGRGNSGAADRALALLERLGIGMLAARKPAELSVGQQQRVGIARALMNSPQVILADEPTSALDDAACAAVVTLLRDVATEAGAQLVVSTHDARVRRYFSKTLRLEAGR